MERQPNILLITTDQQRFDSLGCYGEEAVKTPHLNQLAQEGALFENTYVTNPICTPSRSSLLTGKHLPGHGVYRLHDNLPEDEVLFTERLREVGYETALFGKLHVCGRLYEAQKRHPHDGFDVYEWCIEPSIHLDSPFNGYAQWLEKNHPDFFERLKREGRDLLHVPQECHMTHWAAERTIDYIESWDGESPFFCMMSVFDPHNPYEDYPLEMLEHVDESKVREPYFGSKMEERPGEIQREHNQSYLGPYDDFSVEQLSSMRKGYLASIALLDIEVGRVLEALKRKGLERETLVIFTSDHGDMLGDQQLFVKGAYFYDPCVRVPLIMRWPEELPGGVRVKGLAQLNDIAATILRAAKYPQEKLEEIMPSSCDLLPLAKKEVEMGREYVVCAYRNSGINSLGRYWDPPIYATMIRDETYKLSCYHGKREEGEVFGELFHMERDPKEEKNLWEDPKHAVVKNRLLLDLLGWLVEEEMATVPRGGESLPQASQQLVNRLR